MYNTWILVANSAEARILELGASWGDLDVKATYSNPDGRAHEGDLVTDRGAAVLESTGQGQRRYTAAKVSAKEHASDVFARKLASALQRGRVNNSYNDLVLVAPPPLLGKLRTVLDATTLECVSYEINKNLAQLSPNQLSDALQAQLNP
jgi:protein required for attachment to host cells